MFYLIKYREKKGGFFDVYNDFEEQILKSTGWKFKYEANRILQSLFYRFLLKLFFNRVLYLNFPRFISSDIYFSILSGAEYYKIYHQYSFKSKLKVVYLFDALPKQNKLNENAFRSFKINVAFISTKQAAAYFNSLKIPNFKSHWIPEGIDSKKYKFYDVHDKNIDFLQYGRKWTWYHDILLDFSKKNNKIYKYPITNDKSQFQSRSELIEALARTKVVVCVPRSITHPETHQDFATLTTRYFEAMSAKCLIIGKAPDELIELFGYNPVVEVIEENSLTQLDEIFNNFYWYSDLIERNYSNVLQKHQWVNRVEEILRMLPTK